MISYGMLFEDKHLSVCDREEQAACDFETSMRKRSVNVHTRQLRVNDPVVTVVRMETMDLLPRIDRPPITIDTKLLLPGF